MKKVTFIVISMLLACQALALTITQAHYGYNNGSVRNFKQGSWSAGTCDLSEGSGKNWSFSLPTIGYVNNTFYSVTSVSGFPGANIDCSYSQNQNGYFNDGHIYYQNNGTDILSIGYTGSPNLLWNPAIPTGLPHELGKTWSGTHAYTYGNYQITGKVISEGTLSTHLGSFPALCVRYIYTSSVISYTCYQWETAEYGITAYSNTLNGGMLYVLHQANPNVANEDESLSACSFRMRVYPNPVNEVTTLALELKETGSIKIDLYNLKGQKVLTEVYPKLGKGEQSIDFQPGKGLASGIYYLKVTQGKQSQTSKICLKR